MTIRDWFIFALGFALSPIVLGCAGLALLRYDRWKAAKEDR